VILSPEFDEFVPAAVGAALAEQGRATAVAVERAPVGRQVLGGTVAFAPTRRRTVATFGLALAFYLALGDPTDPFDLVTGVASAGIVAVVLSRVALESDPTRGTVGSVLRAVLFLPYLLYAVVRANLAMAYVVLHPALPIEPSVVRVPAPERRLARALLANSITLTPGTLTVDLTDDELVVHALTAGSRAELEAGALARAVAFVTDGRAGASAGATDLAEGTR
jgi:multicomponent Na+:H+ antiporter subunit E